MQTPTIARHELKEVSHGMEDLDRTKLNHPTKAILLYNMLNNRFSFRISSPGPLITTVLLAVALFRMQFF